jgi:SagB-type dehydrogenase family enzyme
LTWAKSIASNSARAHKTGGVVPARADRARQYRRSPHVVSYWAGGSLVFHNFATGIRASGTALTIGLLDYFDTWRSPAPLLERASMPRATLRRALRKLVDYSLLQESGRPKPVEQAMEQWASWNPAAGFLHFSTKDLPFEDGEIHAADFLSRRLASKAIPASTKTYPRRPGVSLPALPSSDRFSRVLLARRTWRMFGDEPLSLAALSALMKLTFGAQKFMDLGAAGTAMLRTSPSAGARNPLEAYVVVRRARGVAPGVYHYAPVEHRLARIKSGSRSAIERYLPGQAWYGRASILVLITAVFARTEWKYPSPRAYRDVLLEAGHFCQTFCLAATAFGLAPFCTAAMADSLIERDLGLDGVSESVVYACGVGPRPPGVDWAPWPPDERPRLPRKSGPRPRSGRR